MRSPALAPGADENGVNVLMTKERVERGGLILFLAAITLALAAVVSGFAGALLWAALASLLFQPLFQRLLGRWPGRRNLAVALTMLIITFAVVIPALIIASLLVDQAAGVYTEVRSGRINVATYFQQIHNALPMRLQLWMNSSGLDSFDQVQSRVSDAIGNSVSMLAGQALSIGRNAAAFVLAFGVGLYVAFFLLRDGEQIGPAVVRALPLEASVAERLSTKLVSVVRATIKGSGVVALLQGALGAATFWIRAARSTALGHANGDRGIAAGDWAGDHLGPRRALPSRYGRYLTGDRGRFVGRAADRLGRQHPASDPGRARYRHPGLVGSGHDAGRH